MEGSAFDYNTEILDYTLDNLDSIYALQQTTNEALTSSASPSSMKFATAAALLTGTAIYGWNELRESSERKRDLESRYLED